MVLKKGYCFKVQDKYIAKIFQFDFYNQARDEFFNPQVPVHGVRYDHAAGTIRRRRPSGDRAPRRKDLPRPLQHPQSREARPLHRNLHALSPTPTWS